MPYNHTYCLQYLHVFTGFALHPWTTLSVCSIPCIYRTCFTPYNHTSCLQYLPVFTGLVLQPISTLTVCSISPYIQDLFYTYYHTYCLSISLYLQDLFYTLLPHLLSAVSYCIYRTCITPYDHTYCLQYLPVFTFPDHGEHCFSPSEETLHEDSSIRQSNPPIAHISDCKDWPFNKLSENDQSH